MSQRYTEKKYGATKKLFFCLKIIFYVRTMLVTRKKYAELCGCTVSNINYRINNRLILLKKKELPDGTKAEYIDTKKYPPMRIRTKGGGRKKKSVKKKQHN